MAEEMDEVTQRFVADVEEYVEEIKRAADDTQELAAAAKEAGIACGSVRDGAAEAGEALGHTRDEALEAAEALNIYQDAAGRWRDASGRFATAAEVEAAGLGHVRDEAVEATAAVRELKKEQESQSRDGLLSRLLGGGESGGGESGGSLKDIPMIGPLLANPMLLAGVIGLIGAAGAELGGLATGLTAAGLGAGSFAALAIPAFKTVFGAVGDTRAELAKLPEPVQEAVRQVKGLESGFDRMSKAFEPTAFKVLSEGLGVAHELLPELGLFATAAAPAIEHLIGGLGRYLNSPNTKDFLGFLRDLSGPAITAVGSGLAGLAGDVEILMERFSKKDVINSINIAFRVLGTALGLLIGLIMESMMAWDILTQKVLPDARVAFDDTRHAVAAAGHDIAHTFDTLRHDVAEDGHAIAADFGAVRHAVAAAGHDIAVIFDEDRHDIAQWADDVRHDVDRVIAWFEALPGRIKHQTDRFADLLVSAGASLIDGLIHGIDSKVDELRADVEGLGSKVAGWAKGVLGIASPSKVFREIGVNITEGLSLGITETGAQVVAKAGTLAADVARAASEGSITGSEADTLGQRIAAQMQSTLKLAIGRALDGTLRDELTTTGKITKASLTALQQIWDAERGGLITLPQASALATWVRADNQRLIVLNHQREKITKEIAAAKAFAASTTTAAESTFDLAQASARADGSARPRPVAKIISTLQGDAGKIGRFVHRIKVLARDGLNKAYLQQLLALGPDQGAAIAEEWSKAGIGEIRQLNAAEADVARESARLGKTGADALYDSGVQAGKGFLSGLKAQKAAIEHLMAEIAASMVGRLRKDLGISSPSRVMFGHGADTLQGYINGWRSKMPELLALVRETGGGIAGGGHGYGGSYGGGGRGGYASAPSVHVTVPLSLGAGTQGYRDPRFLQALQEAVQEAVLRFLQNNPTNGLTSAGRL